MPYLLPNEGTALGAAIPLFEKIAIVLDDVAAHVNPIRTMFPAPGRDLRVNVGKQFGEHARLTMRNTPQAPPVGVAAGLFWRDDDPQSPSASLSATPPPPTFRAMIGVEVAHENRNPEGVRLDVQAAMATVPGWTSVNRPDDWAVLVVYNPAADFADRTAMAEWLNARLDELLAQRVL